MVILVLMGTQLNVATYLGRFGKVRRKSTVIKEGMKTRAVHRVCTVHTYLLNRSEDLGVGGRRQCGSHRAFPIFQIYTAYVWTTYLVHTLTARSISQVLTATVYESSQTTLLTRPVSTS